MRKLIINADDLGYSLYVNQEIENCIKNGVITSTTLMANAPAFNDGVRIAKQYNSQISVGVHLNIIEFAPLTNIDIFKKHGIVDENGLFIDGAIFVKPINDDLKQAIYEEWDAQITKLENYGIFPTHADSHQHTHTINGLHDILCKVLNKHNIKRVRRKNIPLIRIMLFGSKKLPITIDKSNALQPKRRNVLYRRFHLIVIKYNTHAWNSRIRRYFLMTNYFFSVRDFYLNRSLLCIKGRSSVIELMCHPGQLAFQNETEVLKDLNKWLPNKYELCNYNLI